MVLRCSDQCEESQENPAFKVVVLVDETREIIDRIASTQSTKDFRCAHCDAVAEEVIIYYSAYDHQCARWFGTAMNSPDERTCAMDMMDYLFGASTDPEDPTIEEARACSFETQKLMLEGAEISINPHHGKIFQEEE